MGRCDVTSVTSWEWRGFDTCVSRRMSGNNTDVLFIRAPWEHHGDTCLARVGVWGGVGVRERPCDTDMDIPVYFRFVLAKTSRFEVFVDTSHLVDLQGWVGVRGHPLLRPNQFFLLPFRPKTRKTSGRFHKFRPLCTCYMAGKSFFSSETLGD